jgi:hypothetical protein
MKFAAKLILILAVFGLIMWSPGCGSSSKSSRSSDPNYSGGGGSNGGGTGTGTSTGTGTGGGGSGSGGTPTLGFNSAYSSVQDMHQTFNGWRQTYMSHDRYKGFPWQGSYHNTVTWPSSFKWDDGLAAEAQAEADRLNAGGECKGEPISQMAILGRNTSKYMIATIEPDAGSKGKEAVWSSKDHGSARMAIHYFDPGGDGPVLTRTGIGAAAVDNGNTWWVYIYGE